MKNRNNTSHIIQSNGRHILHMADAWPLLLSLPLLLVGVVAAAATAAAGVVIVINFLGFQRFHILVRFPMWMQFYGIISENNWALLILSTVLCIQFTHTPHTYIHNICAQYTYSIYMYRQNIIWIVFRSNDVRSLVRSFVHWLWRPILAN